MKTRSWEKMWRYADLSATTSGDMAEWQLGLYLSGWWNRCIIRETDDSLCAVLLRVRVALLWVQFSVTLYV